MATGIINPYAVPEPNTDYRDAVQADGPVALWMLDEPDGQNTAVNLGWGGSAVDGVYTGALAGAGWRQPQTIFNIAACGPTAGGTWSGGSVLVASEPTKLLLAAAYGTGGRITYEFVVRYNVYNQSSYNFSHYNPFYSIKHQTNSQYWHLLGVNATSSSGGLVNTDYHVCLVYQNGYQYLYVNGVAVASSSAYRIKFWPYTNLAWQGISSVYNPNLYIGSSFNGAAYMRGAMAGFAVHRQALTAAKIATHYNALLT